MSKASQDTIQALTKLGVVQPSRVDLSDDTVFLSTGETIQTKNLIWAAGVSAIVFDGPAESYGRKTNGYRCIQQGKRKLKISTPLI
jgi:NADH dehydrogenase